MSIINRETLNKKELSPKVLQAIADISACFRDLYFDADARVVLASYLLYEIGTEYNDPEIEYKDMLSMNHDFDENASIVIAELISEEEWMQLVPLAKKYSPEEFAYSAFIYTMTHNARMNKGSEFTPVSIIKLAQRILEIESNDRVADICSGFATFLTECALDQPDALYFGCEINTTNKLIADIRARLVSDNINILLQDAFTLLDDSNEYKFDKIFSNYPFKIPLRSMGIEKEHFQVLVDKYPGLGRATSSDWAFNALICELLSDQGKAVALMTNGSTWNSIDTPMRKQFIENGLIESVITLPARMFSTFSISTTMVVFSKGNDHVRIVDASNLYQQGRRYNTFSDNDIESILAALDNDCDYSRVIGIDELRQNDYSLSLSRYSADGTTFEYATPFEEVIKSITRGAPCNARQLDEMVSDTATTMQYLMLSNIQNGIIEDTLPYLSHIDAKYEKYCLKDNDLILSKNGYPYKLAVAKVQKGHKILANGNLYIIELDQEKIDPYYLKAFFESEQGIAILKSITVGATVPNIGIDNLKKVMIPVPPLEQQKRISEKYQMTLDEIAVYKLKLEKAFSKLHHIFDNESEG